MNTKESIYNIEKNMPHLVCEVMCWKCGHRWIAAFPGQTLLKELECPECHEQGFAFGTGQVLPEDAEFGGGLMRANYYRQEDLEKSRREGFRKGIWRAAQDITNVIALQLQDKHGWTPAEIHALEAEVNYQFDSVLKTYVELDDIERTKKEEIG